MNALHGLIRRRPLSSLLILIVMALAALVWPYRVQLQVFPDIISAYTAKQYCSCRYVMHQPVDSCRAYVKQWLPSTVSEDAVARRITATGLGRESSAVWQGLREGCRLSSPAR